MNILTQIWEPRKQVFNLQRASIVSLLTLLLFSSCKQGPLKSSTGNEVHETGYLMVDGSGYYFIPMDNAVSFKETLQKKNEANGFKFNFERDSIEKLALYYDTLVDLNKQEKGFPAAYIYKRVTPIQIVYSPDSVIAPYLKGEVSLPMRFENGEFTLVYKAGGIKVSKIVPLRKD